jgi:hypothetical protein
MLTSSKPVLLLPDQALDREGARGCLLFVFLCQKSQMSLPREQTDGLMHFAWHLAHPPRDPTIRPRALSEGAGEDGAGSLIAVTGGSYRNISSGMGIVCKSSGVIGGERRVGGG